MIDSIWNWIINSPSNIYLPFMVTGIALGIASGLKTSYWKRLRLAATWVHESGHALAAIVLGRDVEGITINRDSSGVTNSIGEKSRIQQSIVSFMGYPAPAILGSVLLYFLARSEMHVALFILFVIPILMLLLQRSLLGVLLTGSAIMTSVILFALPSPLAVFGISVLAGYLCVASPRTVLELRRYRRAGAIDDESHSDADSLAQLTFIPAQVWEVTFLTTSIALPLLAVALAIQ